MPKFKPGEIWKIGAGKVPYFYGVKDRPHAEDRFCMIMEVRVIERKKYTEYNLTVMNLRSGGNEMLAIDSRTWRDFFFKVDEDV